MKRTLVIIVIMMFMMQLGASAETVTFKDVKDSDWYAKDVREAAELGLIVGKGNGKFEPKGNLTLAEAITLAVRAKNYNDKTKFDYHGGEKWYSKAVEYAYENGMLLEIDETDYNKLATRRDVAVIFALALPEEDYETIESNISYRIPDVPRNGTFETQLINRLYWAGILTGDGTEKLFYPQNNITRGEVSAILNRLVSKNKRVTFPAANIVDRATQNFLDDIRERRNVSQIPAFKEKDIIMHADGVQVDFSAVKPLRYRNAFLELEFVAYPIKPIAEALGFTVFYDAEKDIVELFGHRNSIEVYVNSNRVNWNGYISRVRDISRIRDGSLYVTDSSISEIFGLTRTTSKDGSISFEQAINGFGKLSFSGNIADTVDWDKDGILDRFGDKSLIFSGMKGGLYWDFMPLDFTNDVTINWRERKEERLLR